MKRIFLFALCVLFLGACAGNPPAWWNPGNRYGTTQGTVKSTPAQRAKPVVEEETLEVVDESYEEITLTPMPDEDEENASGAAASQNEALLPDGDPLPLPSVLD